MSRPRTYRTEAVVLRQTTLGEADRILTLYTPDAGKVRAVAKGVRRQKSRLRGHLELLTRVSVSISTGRSLDIVAEAQTIEAFRKVTEDLERLTRGLYIAELTDGFTVEHSSNEPVYRLLVETLERLSTTDRPTLLTRRFEALLLGYSGFGPELYGCVECRLELEPVDHLFSCLMGGVVCPRCRAGSEALVPLSVSSMKVMRLLQRQPDFDSIASVHVSDRLLGELERLLRTYIRYLVDRGLRTTQFMDLVCSPTSARSGQGE